MSTCAQGALGLPAPFAAPALAPALQALPRVPAQNPAWRLGCLAAAEHSPSFELAMWQAAQPPAPGVSAGMVNPAMYPSIGYRVPAGLPAQPPLAPATAGAPDDVLAQLQVQAALGPLMRAAQGGGQSIGNAPGGALSQGFGCVQEAPPGVGAHRLSVDSFGRTGGSLGSNASVSGESDLSSARTLWSSPGGSAALRGTSSQLGIVAQLLPVQGVASGQGFAAPGQGLGAGMLRQQLPLAQGFGPEQPGAPGHFASIIAPGMLRQQAPPTQGSGPGQGLPAFSQGVAAQVGMPQQQLLAAHAHGPGQGFHALGQGVPPHAALPQPPPAGYTPGCAAGLPQPPQLGSAHGAAAPAVHRKGYATPDPARSAGSVLGPGAGAGPGQPHMRAPAPQQPWPPRMPLPKP